MSIHRRAAKRDANEPEIVEALLAVGASVYRISAEGIFDLLVGFRESTYLLEAKTRKGKLTPAQIKFMENWHGAPVFVVRTVDEALRAIGAVD